MRRRRIAARMTCAIRSRMAGAAVGHGGRDGADWGERFLNHLHHRWPTPDRPLEAPGYFSRFQRGAMPGDLDPWIERWNEVSMAPADGMATRLLRVFQASPIIWFRIEAMNPDGTIAQGRLLVSGSFAHATEVPVANSQEHVAIFLRPGSIHAIFGVSAASVINVRVLASEVLGGPGRDLEQRMAQVRTHLERRQLLAAFVRTRLARYATPADRELVACIRSMKHPQRISPITAQLGWSSRQLERLCARGVGIGLKRMSILLRAGDAMKGASALTHPDWADIACAYGFSDQSHFTRAVHLAFGHPPGRFHARIRQSHAWIDGMIPLVGP